ncbi:MAG: hypothetical protein QM535_17560, partial [Limnohabitans sp.]|nr:hypothetical protein [Limnohabitans sp.]
NHVYELKATLKFYGATVINIEYIVSNSDIIVDDLEMIGIFELLYALKYFSRQEYNNIYKNVLRIKPYYKKLNKSKFFRFEEILNC